MPKPGTRVYCRSDTVLEYEANQVEPTLLYLKTLALSPGWKTPQSNALDRWQGTNGEFGSILATCNMINKFKYCISSDPF